MIFTLNFYDEDCYHYKSCKGFRINKYFTENYLKRSFESAGDKRLQKYIKMDDKHRSKYSGYAKFVSLTNSCKIESQKLVFKLNQSFMFINCIVLYFKATVSLSGLNTSIFPAIKRLIFHNESGEFLDYDVDFIHHWTALESVSFNVGDNYQKILVDGTTNTAYNICLLLYIDYFPS